MSWQAKKLVVVSVIIMSMTGKKTEEKKLEQVPYIWYSITFKNQTEALLDSESKVNAMNLAFASQLGLKIWKTNIHA